MFTAQWSLGAVITTVLLWQASSGVQQICMGEEKRALMSVLREAFTILRKTRPHTAGMKEMLGQTCTFEFPSQE